MSDGPLGTAGPLTRVNVNLTPRAVAALDRAVAKTGDSRTDVLNRAVEVFELVWDLTRRGGADGELFIRRGDETERFTIM